MSRLAKILIGVTISLLIFLVALFFFLRHLVTRSYPETTGTLTVDGLHQEATIARDSIGIPHVSASDEHDLMFATGYTHAQDRLWQMELTRRAGEGRLSEIFDTSTVRFDRMFRTLRFAPLAESLYQHLHPESRAALEAYADGVNAYIVSHKGRYPIEFDMLGFDPEPWKPQHSLLVARLMAWELNFAWWVDLTYDEIAAKVDAEKLREVLPFYADSLSTMAVSKSASVAANALMIRSELPELMADVRAYRNRFGIGPFTSGSNAWVVSGSKTVSGKPLLANDPHLKTSVPGRWYEMHLSAPGWNVAGVTLPGAPVVVIGHNDSLAWGFTNAMLDDADFYVEKIDSTRPSRYLYRGNSTQFNTREEMILIGKKDSISVVTRATIHGPVVGDVHPTAGHSYRDILHNRVLALRWTGYEMSDEIYGMLLMNKAANAKQFEAGVSEFTVPAQCIAYADAAGNIGFWMGGRVPERAGGGTAMNAILPQEGWTGEHEWTGYVPFADLPKSWNPPDGMIVCANQKPAGSSYPHYLSSYWESPSRNQRIREMLRGTGTLGTADFQRFQMDQTSPFDREVTRHILTSYPDSTIESEQVRSALEYLKSWDFRETSTDIATTIFNTFFIKLLHNTYEDEMGSATFDDFVFFSAIPYRITAQLLATDSSAWFDNISTPVRETKRDIIHKSLLDALTELSGRLGPEMKQWQWGTVHQAVFSHPFGKRKPLDKVFNVGPYPIGGSATTVNKGEYKLSAPFELFSGPSMREIIDLSKPWEALMITPLGQSGQPMHPHYQDQTAMWLNGGYHRVSIDVVELSSRKLERLVLKPM